MLQSVLFAESYFNQYFQTIAKIKEISLVTFLVMRLEHRQIPEQEIVFFPYVSQGSELGSAADRPWSHGLKERSHDIGKGSIGFWQ